MDYYGLLAVLLRVFGRITATTSWLYYCVFLDALLQVLALVTAVTWLYSCKYFGILLQVLGYVVAVISFEGVRKTKPRRHSHTVVAVMICNLQKCLCLRQ